MRGDDVNDGMVFSYVSMERRIADDHPLRAVRVVLDEVLNGLSRDLDKLYAKNGRPSIPPEQILRALLLQILYTIRSERQLIEQLDYNLLFRWFVGLQMDDKVWNPTVFSKNRDRLLNGEVADRFFDSVVQIAQDRGLLSNEHFSVDGTMIEAAASLKSFQKKGGRKKRDPDDPGNPTINFHGEKRKNDTHESRTDPESRLYRKGPNQEAKLFYMGHAVIENGNGLAVKADLTLATGFAERTAALQMLEELSSETSRRITVGADKAYDNKAFVSDLREANVTPHIAQHTNRHKTAIDARTTRHAGYAVSQRQRKKIEEVFGWSKTIGLLRKVRHRGKTLVRWVFLFTLAAYNIIRIRNLAYA